METKQIVCENLTRCETVLRNLRWNLTAGRIDLHSAGMNFETVAKQLAKLGTLARGQAAGRTVRPCGCARCHGECPACSPGLRPCTVCDAHFAELAKP